MTKKYRDIPFITKYQWVFHLVAIGIVLVVLSLAVQKFSDSSLESMQVDIDPITDNRYLITEDDVKTMINEYVGYDASRGSLKRLNLLDLEYLIDSDRRVESADLYIDKRMILHIDIKQKVPLVRIMTEGSNYYLDKNGDYIPVSGHTVRVPVVTGSLDAYVPNYQLDETHNLNAILTIAKLIEKDDFLKSLVEQINLTDENKIVIAPKMGRNKIKIGDITNLEDKLYRLKIFYSKAISKYGIDKFSELDLQYDGKVFSKSDES